MSGGSMDYLYSYIESNMAFSEHTLERKAFAKHMQKVIKALHDIEWVDSADYGPGDENAAILACLTNSEMLETAIEQANQAWEDLMYAIRKAKEMK